jgi:hypothetical protein
MYFDGTGYYRFLTELDAADFMPAVAPGASGNVLTSNGSSWNSATPSVAWGDVTGTLSNQTDLATALAAKEPSITSGTASQYWRGDKTWQPINWLTSETDPLFTAWKATTPPLYAESDTLASVTARGATTSVASSFTGGLSALSIAGGSTGKMSLTPDVADGASALAFKFDTLNTLAANGFMHTQWLNNGSSIGWVGQSPIAHSDIKGIFAGDWTTAYFIGLGLMGGSVGEIELGDYTPLWIGRYGQARIFVDSNANGGNVGIGTKTPGARLEADTGSASTVGAIIKGSSGQTADLFQVQDSTGASLMRLDKAGNVGIGTTTPGAKLQVNTSASDGTLPSIAVNSAPSATVGATTLLKFQINTSGLTGTAGWYGLSINTSGTDALGASYPLLLSNNNNRYFTMSPSGEITHSPTGATGWGAYQYNGANSSAQYGFFRGSNAQTGISFRNALPTDDGTGVGFRFSVTTNSAYSPVANLNAKVLVVGNGQSPATDVAYVQANGNTYVAGNVGIGTTTPAAPLDVNGGAIIRGAVRLKGYTVATLPAGTQGDTAFVTDAVAPTYLGPLVGGGAVVTPVFYNGTAWVAY